MELGRFPDRALAVLAQLRSNRGRRLGWPGPVWLRDGVRPRTRVPGSRGMMEPAVRSWQIKGDLMVSMTKTRLSGG